MYEQRTTTDTSESEKLLRTLRTLSDRQKSAEILSLTRDVKEDAFDSVTHPHKSSHSIYSYRDLETNIRHVHRNSLKRSDTLRSLTKNYEGLANCPLGMGSSHLNSAHSIKSLSLSTDKCENLPAGVLPRDLNPEELYIKLIRTKMGERFGKKIISFIRRSRSNLRWLKLTLKGDPNSNFNSAKLIYNLIPVRSNTRKRYR